MLDVGYGAAVRAAPDPRQRDDLAGRRILHLDPFQPFVHIELGHFGLLHLLARVHGQQQHLVAHVHDTALDPPDAEPAEVWREVDRGDEHLERRRGITRRRRHLGHDGVEQGREVHGRDIHVHRRHTLARRRVDDGHVELRLVGLELDEEIEHLVVHAHGVRTRPVDLVDHHDGRAAELQRLAQDEPRLRHGAVEGVDHEEHAVDHAQNTLDLTAEIGVTRRVHDVDLGALPPDGRVLREDGDPALTLQWIGIHHALGDDLILAEGARLAEHLVHERGLAVIDVRNDGDVPNLHSLEIYQHRGTANKLGREATCLWDRTATE